MSIKMHAYKNGSESAKALRDALGIKMLLPNGRGKWKGKVGDKIVNWGSCETHPNRGLATYTNDPEAVVRASNKLLTQKALDGKAYALPWTESRQEALQWLQGGEPVMCRTLLRANSGRGIVIAEQGGQEVVQAPLYTKYVKKTDEYRIHVFDGKVIDIQRKARKKEVADENVDWKVRNLDGGFIFARNGVKAPQVVLASAIDAVDTLGLLHGAVDIGYHARHGTYVYEVNTACGLEGSTLINYADAFAEYLDIPAQQLNVDRTDYIPMADQGGNGRDGADGVDGINPVEVEPVQEELELEPVEEPVEEVQEVPRVLHNITIFQRNGNNKIMAIKAIRSVSGLGLKESKQIIDMIWDRGFQNVEVHCTTKEYLIFKETMAQAGYSVKLNLVPKPVKPAPQAEKQQQALAIDIERGNLKLKVPEDKLIEFLLKVEGLDV